MRDAILVAPLGALWAEQARAVLIEAGVHVARLSDLGVVGMLVIAGNVEAVLVDQRLLDEKWRRYLFSLAAMMPGTRVIAIQDPDDRAHLADGSVGWPEDPRIAAALLGLA
jgi:hypothetical protein